MEYVIVLAILGLIPAFIAQQKGRNFIAWWVYGFFLFLIALIHSLFLKEELVKQENVKTRTLKANEKECPFCVGHINLDAVTCYHCGERWDPDKPEGAES